MPKGRDNPPPKPLRGTLADHRPAARRCLGPCGRQFQSLGPANRMCPRCRAAATNVSLREGRQLSGGPR